MNALLLFLCLTEIWLSGSFCETAVGILSHVENLGKYKPLLFTVNPKDQVTTDGVLEFSCYASGIPKPKVVWYNATDKRPVIDRAPSSESSTGIHVNQYHGKLMISNPIRGLIYSFYCNASNSAGWIISNPPVTGALAYIDSVFRNFTSSLTVHERDSFTLDCFPPNGLPKVDIFWTKQDERITVWHLNSPNVSLHVMSFLNGTLYIKNAVLGDTGLYYCHAYNIAGTRRSTATAVKVLSSTIFLQTPKSMRVRIGQDVKFYCETEKQEIVRWKRAENESLIDHSRALVGPNFLLIRNTSFSDSGTYICFTPTSMEYRAKLHVDTPPEFVTKPTDLHVQYGEKAIFHCVAKGNPAPSTYWELPDMTPVFPTDLDNSKSPSKYILHPQGYLEIRNVDENDKGRYRCTAHSSVDTIHVSARLYVGQRPVEGELMEFTQNVIKHLSLKGITAPVIWLPPGNQTASKGDQVIMPCETGYYASADKSESSYATNSATVLVRWDRETYSTGHLVENWISAEIPIGGRYVMLSSGSLRITNAQPNDSGIYTCVAEIKLDWLVDNRPKVMQLRTSWSSELHILPDVTDEQRDIILASPSKMLTTEVTTHSAIIVWKPPRKVLIYPRLADSMQLAYWVEYYQPNRPFDGWIVVEQNWPFQSIELRGLEPDTEYYFLIRSRWKNRRIGWAGRPIGPIRTKSLGDAKRYSVENTAFNYNSLSASKTTDKSKLFALHLFSLSTTKIRVQWKAIKMQTKLNEAFNQMIVVREVSPRYCIPLLKRDHFNLPHDNSRLNQRCQRESKYNERLSELLQQLEELRGLREFQSQPPVSYETTTDSCHVFMPSVAECGKTVDHLYPFRCYEIAVVAYLPVTSVNQLRTYKSNTEMFLTPQDAPTSAPKSIQYGWIGKRTMHLTWDTPDINEWNGLLTGYIIRVTNEVSFEVVAFNTTHSVLELLIQLPSWEVGYTVSVAAKTCAGVGLYGEAILSNVTKWTNFAATNHEIKELGIKFWVIGALIASGIAWFGIFSVLALHSICSRCLSKKSLSLLLDTKSTKRCMPANSCIAYVCTTNKILKIFNHKPTLETTNASKFNYSAQCKDMVRTAHSGFSTDYLPSSAIFDDKFHRRNVIQLERGKIHSLLSRGKTSLLCLLNLRKKTAVSLPDSSCTEQRNLESVTYHEFREEDRKPMPHPILCQLYHQLNASGLQIFNDAENISSFSVPTELMHAAVSCNQLSKTAERGEIEGSPATPYAASVIMPDFMMLN